MQSELSSWRALHDVVGAVIDKTALENRGREKSRRDETKPRARGMTSEEFGGVENLHRVGKHA
jgi:hypothetical protein